MKTSVELDEKKVETAKKLGQVSTIRELLDQALDSFIAEKRRVSMLDLLGRNSLDIDLKSLREKRGNSR